IGAINAKARQGSSAGHEIDCSESAAGGFTDDHTCDRIALQIPGAGNRAEELERVAVQLEQGIGSCEIQLASDSSRTQQLDFAAGSLSDRNVAENTETA